MYPSSLTNLEQAWFHLPVFILGRYVTAPASVNSATVVCLVYPPVTTNLSSISIPQAYLNNVKHYFMKNSVICHKYYIYNILYGSLKSKEEEDPFLETLSVFGECRCPMPPMSRTSPDLSPQQRWLTLLSTSLTGSKMKLEIPSNLSQLLYASGLKKVPPHTILLQKVCPPLGWTRWSTEQVSVVIGLNASAKFLYFLLMKPPVMIIPGKKEQLVKFQFHFLN